MNPSINTPAQTQNRKADHIRICLEDNVECSEITTGLEKYRFTHVCLPELNDKDIDQNNLLYACKVANITEFIESLPLGFNTKIGSEGNGISAGQKQRVLIARAIYKNPEYIFFDEATSALDANNEKVIMENLNAFFKGKTVIVVAHRLSTVKHADNIVVLHQGTIVEAGTHEELVKSKAFYYELVKNQLELGN